jgi:hypothetical protein
MMVMDIYNLVITGNVPKQAEELEEFIVHMTGPVRLNQTRNNNSSQKLLVKTAA